MCIRDRISASKVGGTFTSKTEHVMYVMDNNTFSKNDINTSIVSSYRFEYDLILKYSKS